MNPFPDWLNPILVKELRQGLRSTIFTLTFLLLQAGMLYYTLYSFSSGSGVQELFWFIITILFLLIIPFRGVGVLNDEIRDNTLDLLLLTELSPRRIVFGKWLALGMQSLLILVTILPYVMLTYFLGDGDLFTEVLGLASLFVGGMAVTTLMMQIPQTARLLAFLLVPVLFFMSAFGAGAVLARGLIVLPEWPITLALGTGSLLYLALSLENVAGRITPPGVNTTFLKRLLVAPLLLGAVVLAPRPSIFLFAFLALVPFFLDILCERPAPLASLYLPLKGLRTPWRERFLMPLLYPGTASGLLYFTVLIAVASLLTLLIHNDASRLYILLEGAGILFIPLILVRLLPGRKPLMPSILLQVVIFFIAILLFKEGVFSSPIDTIPPFGFWSYLFGSMPPIEMGTGYLILPSAALAVVLLILLLIYRKDWTTIRTLKASLQAENR